MIDTIKTTTENKTIAEAMKQITSRINNKMATTEDYKKSYALKEAYKNYCKEAVKIKSFWNSQKEAIINNKPTSQYSQEAITNYKITYASGRTDTYKIDIDGCILGLGYQIPDKNNTIYQYYSISLFDLLKLLKNKDIEDTKNRLIDANMPKNKDSKNPIKSEIALNKVISIKHKQKIGLN